MGRRDMNLVNFWGPEDLVECTAPSTREVAHLLL